MSYSAMIPFNDDGSHDEYFEYRNSWGLHARIWSIVQRHLGWSGGEWLSRSEDDFYRLMGLVHHTGIPDHERIALAMTFDRCWIPCSAFKRVAGALLKLDAEHPKENAVSHFQRVAAHLLDLQKRTDLLGVGFYGTSVSDNPWIGWDDPEGEELGPDSEGSQSIEELLPDLFARTTPTDSQEPSPCD